MAVEYRCCEMGFFIRITLVVFLVLFAGLMSGLTLGLMSMSLVDLEVLAKSGTPNDRKHASKILPVVRRQHLLLCTLLLCNAAAMETLPIFLDGLVTAWGAILISVTLILLVGELLDYLLGEGNQAVFRRAELITLVDFHGNEAGKGGELTHDETTIITGALELTEKTASDAMTPISDTFAIDINAKLDRNLMKLIMEKGHSRVPVYYHQPINIIGLILAKNLLTTNQEGGIPVKNVTTIRRIPRVSETMPLYDILNEFQKGYSHMAVVIKNQSDTKQPASEHSTHEREVRVDFDSETHLKEKCLKTKRSLKKLNSFSHDANLHRGASRSKKWGRDFHSEVLHITDDTITTGEGEAVGIITLEDVIEELLQEEIYDETDYRAEINS
ncbi:hypothetical protein LWI29_017820 [Acer saccharum]|uniref:CNNM transmembrane domain-containing protein n=1 Tax=Acer saccharum TaxID=4024 RepID=A0AA39W6J6_ACESA|nr:hypothetical protein LWI29_017820 [Acer saccharum]